MSNWKHKRDLIAGFLVFGGILAAYVIQIARFAERYTELVNSGFYIGLGIFAMGVILVTIYVIVND